MNEINANLNEQTGGWFKVSIIPLSDIKIQPKGILDNSNAKHLTITENPNALDIFPLGESIQIQATPKKTSSGFFYDIKGEFDIAYQSAKLDSFLNQLIHDKVILIGIKHNRTQIIYGAKNSPLFFSYQLFNGKKYQDGSRIKISVTGKTLQKPVFATP